MSLYCSSHLLWSYILRWLESFVFVVLIGVEKESSKRQTGLTCVNGSLHYCHCYCYCTATRNLVGIPTFENMACIQNGSMWYAEIWNLNWRLLSEIVESFQPLGASPVFTTESDAESLYSVVCPCPLTSYTSRSISWLTYYCISSMQL